MSRTTNCANLACMTGNKVYQNTLPPVNGEFNFFDNVAKPGMKSLTPPVSSCRGSGDLPRPTPLREGPSAVSLAPRARYLSTPGRGLCAEVAFACGRRACFAKSPESVTLVEFGSPPRRLGLAPVRRASAPDGFICDPRRDTSSRNTASSSRTGLAANPPNRVRPAHSARHAPPRIRASPQSGILKTPCGAYAP